LSGCLQNCIVLDLSRNRIGDAAAGELCHQNSLHTLILSGVGLHSLAPLGESLSDNHHLVELDLSFNYVDQSSIEHLEHAREHPPSHLPF
jgi:hypothetical protein